MSWFHLLLLLLILRSCVLSGLVIHLLLIGAQLCIDTVLGNQLRMASIFSYLALLHDKDLVSISHSRQSMGNDNCCDLAKLLFHLYD